MATSHALRDFCVCARESELLRARRKVEQQQAREARKAAELVLRETLGSCGRARFVVGSEKYVVATKERVNYDSCTSGVVNRLAELWKDPEALRQLISEETGEDVIDNATRVFRSALTGPARTRVHLEVRKMKAAECDDLDELPACCEQLALTLMHAKAELQRGGEEHREELKRLQQKRSTAEHLLVQELSGQQETMRRVNLLENDGTAQSYFLRLKPPRPAVKRKITPKCLSQNIRELLADEIGTLHVDASLQRICSDDFCERFLESLQTRLRAHETPATATQDPQPRVALDRVRMCGTPDVGASSTQ